MSVGRRLFYGKGSGEAKADATTAGRTQTFGVAPGSPRRSCLSARLRIIHFR